MRKMEKPERGKAEKGHRLRKAHPLGPPTGRRYSRRLFIEIFVLAHGRLLQHEFSALANDSTLGAGLNPHPEEELLPNPRYHRFAVLWIFREFFLVPSVMRYGPRNHISKGPNSKDQAR